MRCKAGGCVASVLHQNGGIVQMSFLRQTLLYQTCAVSMEMNGQIIVPLSARVSYTVNEQVHQSRHAHTHPGHVAHITVQYAVQASPCFCSLIRLSLYMEGLSVRLRGERSLKQKYIPQGHLLARGEMAEVFALIPSTPVWICRHGLDIRLTHQCLSRRDRDARAQSAKISLRWEIPQGSLDVQEKSKWGRHTLTCTGD